MSQSIMGIGHIPPEHNDRQIHVKTPLYHCTYPLSLQIPGKFKAILIKGNPPEMYSIEKDRTAYFMTIRGDKGES